MKDFNSSFGTRSNKRGIGIGLALSCVLVPLFMGVLTGLFGGVFAAGLSAIIIYVLLLIKDYRIGVATLVVILPFLSLHYQGANVFMATLIATLSVFLVQKSFSRKFIIRLPGVAWIGLVFTICMGAFLTFQHLDEVRIILGNAEGAEMFSLTGFFRFNLLIPLGIILLAWLFANAVMDSKRPEDFIILFSIVGGVIVFRILHFVATSGLGLSELASSRNRELFSALGHHANAFGPMLAVAAGPFLFLTADSKGWARVYYGAVLITLMVGCALVFSRGGYLAFVVEFGAFLLMRRRLKIFLGVLFVGTFILFAAPEAIIERATTGFDSQSLAMLAARSAEDPLTAGRFALYEMFVPEVFKSPIWGGGTGSGAWSDAVRGGLKGAWHPHNTYLRVLMDVGVLGLLFLGYFWSRIANVMRALSCMSEINPTMRSYFAGAFAGVLGLMAAWLSGGPHWLPDPDQPFLWYSVGMTFAFWYLRDTSSKSVKGVRGSPASSTGRLESADANLKRRSSIRSTLGR